MTMMPLSQWRERFSALVPVYFILRTTVLLVFGLISLVCVFANVWSQTKGNGFNLQNAPLQNAPLIVSGMLLLLSMMLSNLYVLLVYPLKTAACYPRTSRHPLLAGLVIVSFLLFIVFFHLALQTRANPYLLLSLPAVLVGAVSGLSWRVGITLILSFNAIMTLLLPSNIEPLFWGFMLCSQWVVYILFKVLIGEFHTKTLLFQRLVELQATQRLLRESVEREIRYEVARNLHDELGHLATRISLALGQLQQLPLQQAPQLLEAQTLTRTLHQQLRSIAASWTGLGKIDLKSSLEALAQQIVQPRVQIHYLPSTGPAGDGLPFDGLCSPAAAEAIFRACQEGITNCLRHSNATQLNISLQRQGNLYVVDLKDNGTHYQTDNEWRGHWGNGLRGIQERLRQLGGQLTCAATSSGFAMQLTLPLQAHEL